MLRTVAAALFLVLAPDPARAEVFGATYRGTEWGVEMTVPRGWELSDQPTYPGLLARAFEHKGRARMTLAAQRMLPAENGRGYVERNQQTLAKLGYRILGVAPHGNDALLLDALTPDGKRSVRQAYLARGETVYVLSLAVQADLGAAYVRPFEETLRGLVFTFPVPPLPTPSTPSETKVP